ncbi:NAD(P)H-dependent FMN reductase [Novosphingobium kunmingense]|uniref:NAD(P)H-dependent FMN reductase n=1 Tax=Novosphingobium kunmingense TaxID=1211806 RepID=A0A2N0H3A3_9SPHN|nr:NADPH-dependent FMN reductase [Novosphingobium kunmingense]PKB13426.1 NAD(P)H-dependent FMN reductase [Novosphingobium kunmingense]
MATTIGIIAGSAREGSLNVRLAELIAERLAQGGKAVWQASHADLDLPIFHGDLERTVFPAAALALKQRIAACDALVLVSPEYNSSVAPLLKNALDWASRSTGDEMALAVSAFRGKPVLLASATPGPGAGIRVLGHLRQIVQALQMLALPIELRVGNALAVFGGDVPDALTGQIALACDSLVDLAERLRP